MSYLLSKLSSKSQEFVSGLTNSNKSRSPEASLALAKVLAYQLHMPSSEVEDIVMYSKLNYHVELMTKIDGINQLTLLNVEEVLEYVGRYYKFRYYALFGAGQTLALNSQYAVADYFDITKAFSKETIDMIVANPLDMTTMTNGFIQLLADLKGE